MTTKEKKLKILRMLDAHCKHLYRIYLEKKAACAAYKAGRNQWDLDHPDDGVGCFSSNRYSEEGENRARQEEIGSRLQWEESQELCDYAMESLVE